MRVTISRWLNQEFVALSAEAKPELPPDEALPELLGRFDVELRKLGMSRDRAVRGRLWGRDREAWRQGSRERFKFLSGKARAASSSYIAQGHFDSTAVVAFDLLAMRPPGPNLEKNIRDYEPPTNVLRFLIRDPVVFLSGVTWEHGQLADQLESILPRIGQSLADAGASWRKVARMACFLERDQPLDDLKRLLSASLGSDLPAEAEYCFVDGYSTPGKLIEIEVTAVL